MLSFQQYITEESENLVKAFHNSLTDQEKKYYKKRDNCGPAASHLCKFSKDPKRYHSGD